MCSFMTIQELQILAGAKKKIGGNLVFVRHDYM